jgi:hypothetical protein
MATAAPEGGADPATVSAVAHSAQNFAVAPFAVPHAGQAMASRVAHSVQNFAPIAFSVPQFEQITQASPRTM